MSSRILKNHQVNLGRPYEIKSFINFNTIKTVKAIGEIVLSEESDLPDSDEFGYQNELEKAREEAEMVLKEAQYEALRIIEKAEIEANQLRISIEENARLNGYNEGYKEAGMEYENLLKEAESIKEQAKTEHSQVLAGIEQEAIGLILEIAKSVIGKEISFNKENLLYLIKQAFEKCSNKESAVLKVSSEDYEFITDNKTRMFSMVEGIGDVEIKSDSSLRTGACILETPYGMIDAGIHTKLNKVEEAFYQVVGK